MKKTILISTILTSLMLVACNQNYREGSPVIVKKEFYLFNKCKFTYEGWGRKDYFEDDCDKYQVGDKIGE